MFCVLSLKLCVHMSLQAHSVSGHRDISCWGVQEPCSSGSSEDPLVSPHTTPSLILSDGPPFVPPAVVSGKAPRWEPISGAWMRDPFPPAPGSAQSQHTARLPGRLGLLALALVSAILGGVPGPSVHLLFSSRLLLAECQSRRGSDGPSVLPSIRGVHPPALRLLPPPPQVLSVSPAGVLAR